MRGTVVVQTPQEFKAWIDKQPAYYVSAHPATPATDSTKTAAPPVKDTTAAGKVASK